RQTLDGTPCLPPNLHPGRACVPPWNAKLPAKTAAHLVRPNRAQTAVPQPNYLPRPTQSWLTANSDLHYFSLRAPTTQSNLNPALRCHESRAKAFRAPPTGLLDAHWRPTLLALHAVALQPPGGAQFRHVARDRQRKWQWQRPCQSRDRPLLPLPRFQDAATRAQTLRPATTPGKSIAPAQALRYARSKAP